VTWVYSLYSRF